MGEITEKRMRHYVGLDADKASIPAGGKSKGDSYHANDKGKQYYWDGANWKTGLGYEFVPRSLAAWDFREGVFTIDGAWHVDGLDCSVIVPAGAVAISFFGSVLDNAANSDFLLRQNAVSSLEVFSLRTQVANVGTPNLYGVVPCDTNRLIDYAVTAGLNNIFLSIIGWYI